MNILTVGSSPYLNTSYSRIHKELIIGLKKNNYHVESIVTSHDISYFLPDQNSKFYYNDVEINPFLGEKGELSSFCMNVMKTLQPHVVITIGSKLDHIYMAIIKSIYPNLFKWIAIIPSVGPFYDEIFDLNLADTIVLTNKKAYLDLSANPKSKNKVVYFPFGADNEVFYNKNVNKKLSGIYVCKNYIKDNLPIYMRSLTHLNIPGYLHYNHDDYGNYDVNQLVKEYNSNKYISLPHDFCSVKEGISDIDLNDKYNASFMVFDCSIQPEISLSSMEGMLTGCLPIGPQFGAMADIINELPEEYRFFIPFEKIKWLNCEDGAILLEKDLISVLENIKHLFMNDNIWRKDIRDKISKVAIKFSKEKFIQNIKETVNNIANEKNAIIVDSY